MAKKNKTEQAEVVNPEHEQLMATLKFTPRTYKISMWGYGGEKVMGTVDRAVWDYCMENQVDLSEIAWSDEETVQDEMGLDVDRLPFPPGSWYECDDMVHTNGVSRNAGTLQIEDENGTVIFERRLEDCDGCSEDSPVWSCNDEAWVGSKPAGTVVFIGTSNEKGTFFEGEIELTQPFDIELLELHYDEIDGEELVNGVVYDGEDIDNWGGSTDGKSSDFGMYLVKDRTHGKPMHPKRKIGAILHTELVQALGNDLKHLSSIKSDPHSLVITVVHGKVMAQHTAQHTGTAHNLVNGNMVNLTQSLERL